MFEKIHDELMTRYGHLDPKQMEAELRKNGLGMFADFLSANSDVVEQMARELRDGVDGKSGVIPSAQIHGVPLSAKGTFRFDNSACLQSCAGECCKHKNYLMITLPDIHNSISSRGGELLGIRSTRDLFEGKPPLLELFYSEEYQLFFHYIRYRPVGGDDATTPPEEAEDSVCPFLRPVKEVYELHAKNLPAQTWAGAMGCMLMESKPFVCRCSPIGKMTGLETGKISYEYLPPALDCPACDSAKEVPVSDYISSIELPGEEAQGRCFHQVLMKNHKTARQAANRESFHAITKDIYNIDGMLARYGLDVEHRPGLAVLVEVMQLAAAGDFSGHEKLIRRFETARAAHGAN